MHKRPQVLLIGNGINRAFSGGSWFDVLDEIKTRPDIDVRKLKSPMPLMATLVTGNKVHGAVAGHQKQFFGTDLCAEQTRLMSRLLSLGFDDILTTNYSYELEADAEGRIPDADALAASHSFNRCDGCKSYQTKYMMHTYNRETGHGLNNRIWHIHGEARKPDSIIIGHYYYANLLNRMQTVVAKNYCELYADGKTACDSWLDSFIFGDVYVLGFGFDFSEFDLWWLVNRKQREKDQYTKTGRFLHGLKGRVYWFEPDVQLQAGEINEKRELLTNMGVQCEDAGYTALGGSRISKKDASGCESPSDYRQYYFDAAERIAALMAQNGQKTPIEE